LKIVYSNTHSDSTTNQPPGSLENTPNKPKNLSQETDLWSRKKN